MPYNIAYIESVIKEDIPALPKKNREQIKRAIEERLKIDPVGFGKPLRYSLKGHRRLRVGDWRVIYRIGGNDAIVSVIGNRKDIYDD